ncbi:PREDICTED: cell wall / vacuolar inhibitor of fructosidase 1-like [Camelina sativa]|uniref:Cell wall / vacuolar inhibitor of fructosidase 1-like n=1 Tax=Camelina sativa TaxID=90675 RepID=A0ABM0WDZ0_CAMSA|nr:PREDICTED: cell wall / vacuolar inhibitor of fructosidase 1-like [Camelina sativa]
MATMLTNHMWFLITTLLLFAFPTANAIPKRDVENLCRESTDFSFCLTSLESDPRIAAARDLHDVLLIAITLSKIQVDDATTHIGTVSRKFSGPNGKRRIGVCRRNYGIASNRFQTAWELALKKSYGEMEKQAKVGTNAVVDCENAWRRGGPVQTSPLTFYNTNVSKLSGIIFLIFRKLK